MSLIGQLDILATLSLFEVDYTELKSPSLKKFESWRARIDTSTPYMRYYLRCILRNTVPPFQSSSRYLDSKESRRMATQLAHSQDATTGEEIASTTVPQKETPPKRNACTPPSHPRFPYPLLTPTFSQRSHVSQKAFTLIEAAALKYSSVRSRPNNHLPRPRRSGRLYHISCFLPYFKGYIP